tara:strand:- start:42 stop:449 length:408 start_codon:yes stop_codon:yes gene_type:complete
MNTEIYIYIPREELFNINKKRIHRKDNNFINLFYYKNKKKYKINNKDIQEIDIYKTTKIQSNIFYKDVYKSSLSKCFDCYYKLKPEYENNKDIYIKKESKKNDSDYEKNKKEILEKNINHNKIKKNNISKLTIQF